MFYVLNNKTSNPIYCKSIIVTREDKLKIKLLFSNVTFIGGTPEQTITITNDEDSENSSKLFMFIRKNIIILFVYVFFLY